MCTPWTPETWINSGQYTLIGTRYSKSREVARIYQDNQGYYWAVLPGVDNYRSFSWRGGKGAALDYLEQMGFNLTEKPVTIVELVGPDEPDSQPLLGLGDLVENFA